MAAKAIKQHLRTVLIISLRESINKTFSSVPMASIRFDVLPGSSLRFA